MTSIIIKAGNSYIASKLNVGDLGRQLPLPPSDLIATAINSNQIDVVWTDTSINELRFLVERSGDGITFDVVAIVGYDTNVYSDISLSPNSTYYYRVRSENNSGRSTPSNIGQATTNSDPIPEPPSDLTVFVTGDTTATIGWADNSEFETGFIVYQSYNGSDFEGLDLAIGVNETSVDLTELVPDGVYIWKVLALNSSGSSDFSNSISATMPNSSTQPPVTPNSFAATTVSSTIINLSWNYASGNTSGVKVERSVHNANSFTQIATVANSSNTYADSGLSASTSYDYRIRAYNINGNSSYTSTQTATTNSPPEGAPNAPTNLRNLGSSSLVAPDTPQNAIPVAWNFSGAQADEFRLYRSSDGGITYTLRATISGSLLTYTDRGLNANSYYRYRLTAYNIVGESSFSNVLATNSLPNGPVAPSGLTVTSIKPDTINLSWTDNSNNEVYFEIERSVDGSNWTKIAYRQAGAKNYSDIGLTSNATYYYRVRATNTGGISGYSSIQSTTTLSSLPAPTAPSSLGATVLSPTGVRLSWTTNGNRIEDNFEVERSEDGGSTWRLVNKPWVGTTKYVDEGLVPQTTYNWRIRSVNTTGATTWSNTASATTTTVAEIDPPTAPSNLSVIAVSDTILSVQWQLNAADETGTKIEISSDSGNTWVQSVVAAKWWFHVYVTGLTASTSYQVRARTYNSGGNSSYTSTVTSSTLTNGSVLSPTGRNPKLVWTGQQHAIWMQMKSDYESNPSSPSTWGGQLYKTLKSNADKTGTASQLYADYGFWAAIMYQITGDSIYAVKSYNEAVKYFPPNVNLSTANTIQMPNNTFNFIREHFHGFCWLYDFIYPGLNNTQRDLFIGGLNSYAEFALGINIIQYKGGARAESVQSADDDQASGHYFGLALMAVANTPSNPKAVSWMFQRCEAESLNYPVGGLEITGVNRNSLVNCIMAQFAALSEGGEWVTSSEYNKGTTSYVSISLEGIRTARSYDGDNNEYFASMREVSRHSGIQHIYGISNDLSMPWQWGDDENARELGGNNSAFTRISHFGLHAALAQGNADIAPYCLEVAYRYYTSGYYGGNTPDYRFYARCTPYSGKTSVSTLPRGRYAPGVAIMYVHDGWNSDDSFFGAIINSSRYLDHADQLYIFGDFQLYRKNEWVVTHPIGYGGLCPESESNNCMLIGGLSGVHTSSIGMTNFPAGNARRVVAQQFGESYEYSYIAGENYGGNYVSTYYQPPPAFLYEHTRSLLYLTSANKKSDVIICVDRTLASNPNYLPQTTGSGTLGVGRYRSNGGNGAVSDQNRINFNPTTGTPALKQWIIHSPVSPTLEAGLISWTTSNNQMVKVFTLLPTSQQRVVFNESTLWSTPLCQVTQTAPESQERKYQTRVYPSTAWPNNSTPTWDFFLNVIVVHDADETIEVGLVQSNDQKVSGAIINKEGENTITLFSSNPSTRVGTTTTFNRVLVGSFDVSFTNTQENLKIYIFDLSINNTWAYSLDENEPVSLEVSNNGVAEINASISIGTHTIEFLSL